MQCKIVHRIHFTKLRLSNIYKDVDPSCDRCSQTPANHTHMFWSCPSLQSYWTEIFKSLSDITGKNIEPTPLTALFGVSPTQAQLSVLEMDLVSFVTLLARRLILLRWKSSSPPSFSMWIKDVLGFVKLEKIRCSMNGSAKNFFFCIHRKAHPPHCMSIIESALYWLLAEYQTNCKIVL